MKVRTAMRTTCSIWLNSGACLKLYSTGLNSVDWQASLNCAAATSKSAIGDIVRKQALIMGFSDTFAVLGILVFAAAMIVMMTKGGKSGGAATH
jgi:hypothetical protein